MPAGVPRVPAPKEWLLTKVCTRCGERKPWACFSPVLYWEDGTVRRVRSHCKDCDAAWTRARYPEYRARNREKVRAYQREWKRRRDEELRAERNGLNAFLPAGPFRVWLLAQLDEIGSWLLMAERWDVPERSLRRSVKESDRVSLSLADKCITRAGCHLGDVYPEYVESGVVLSGGSNGGGS